MDNVNESFEVEISADFLTKIEADLSLRRINALFLSYFIPLARNNPALAPMLAVARWILQRK